MSRAPAASTGIGAVPVALAALTLAVPGVLSAASSILAPPPPLAGVLTVAPALAGIGLGALLLLLGPSMPGGPVVLRVFGRIAIGLAVIAAVVSLGVRSTATGPGTVLADLAGHAWLLAVLLLIAVPARTVGWLQLLGAAICGFFGVTAAARLVGVPVVDALGPDDLLATSVWVPVTEEVLKAVPVVIAIAVGSRNRSGRLSVVDLGLVGAASGAGFAIAENALFGRAYASWTSVPGLSLLLPTIDPAHTDAVLPVIAGHAVWTGLCGLGIGFAWWHRRRFRLAWVVAPAALLLATIEHGALNLRDVPLLLLVPIGGGLLSSVLLLGGFIGAGLLERRRPTDRAALVAGLGLAPPGPHRAALATGATGARR